MVSTEVASEEMILKRNEGADGGLTTGEVESTTRESMSRFDLCSTAFEGSM